jgi:hypothetical protein
MLFATTIGEHAIWVFFAAWALVLIAIKIIGTIDDDGQVKKTANERLAEWIRRRFE